MSIKSYWSGNPPQGVNRYRVMLEELDELEPLPQVFHQELIDLLRKYYFVGGMPEAVKFFHETGVDVGLLGAMAEISVDVLSQGERLFSGYQGAFVENFVAQQLVASLDMGLYYWKSEGKMAELDFLCAVDGDIYPLEVKAGINPKSKSLRSYDHQFDPRLLMRTTLLNLKMDGKICNLPLYGISCLRQHPAHPHPGRPESQRVLVDRCKRENPGTNRPASLSIKDFKRFYIF